jgi:hypothetical protein
MVKRWSAILRTTFACAKAAVPANVALDEMNPQPRAIADPVRRRDALASARVNFREVDKAPEDALNRILWRAMKGPREPYPEWAVRAEADGDDDD